MWRKCNLKKDEFWMMTNGHWPLLVSDCTVGVFDPKWPAASFHLRLWCKGFPTQMQTDAKISILTPNCLQSAGGPSRLKRFYIKYIKIWQNLLKLTSFKNHWGKLHGKSNFNVSRLPAGWDHQNHFWRNFKVPESSVNLIVWSQAKLRILGSQYISWNT